MAKQVALYVLLVSVAIAGITTAPPLTIVILVFFGFKIYELVYFRSAKFIAIKNRISAHIQDCNDLNDHIEELKSTHIGADMTRRGHSDYHDNSKWNFKRSGFKKITNAPNVYNCSRSVCDGSRRDPMKYVCKYFGFSADEPTLSKFENMLNNFTAVEDGKNSLTSEKKRDSSKHLRRCAFPHQEIQQKTIGEEARLQRRRFERYILPVLQVPVCFRGRQCLHGKHHRHGYSKPERDGELSERQNQMEEKRSGPTRPHDIGPAQAHSRTRQLYVSPMRYQHLRRTTSTARSRSHHTGVKRRHDHRGQPANTLLEMQPHQRRKT